MSQCDHCERGASLTRYVDRAGHVASLCGRCLGDAVQRNDLAVRIELMNDRLRAQQAQYRRLEQDTVGRDEALERDLEWFRSAYLAAVAREKRRSAPIDTQDLAIKIADALCGAGVHLRRSPADVIWRAIERVLIDELEGKS